MKKQRGRQLAGTLSGDNLLTRVVPADFKLRPETEPLTSGADLERLLKPLRRTVARAKNADIPQKSDRPTVER